MKNIGENILNLRKSRQLTQESLASMIGVSTQTVSKWENNTNMPDITLLPIIADIFEVTIDELFGRTNSTESCDPNEVFDITCDDLLRNIIKSGENGEEHSVEELLEHFKSCLDDPRTRTGIFSHCLQNKQSVKFSINSAFFIEMCYNKCKKIIKSNKKACT